MMVPNDEKLLESYEKGEEAFLKYVIDTYAKALYNFVRRFGFNNEEAEDILQNVFIKVWKNIDNFDEEKASFKTWIFTITRNTIYDALRKKKNSKIIFNLDDKNDDEKNKETEDFSADILKILERETNKNILLKSIDSLNEEEKTILLLHFEEGMTFDEIGEVLKSPLNTVKSKYRRSLIKLKEILNTDLDSRRSLPSATIGGGNDTGAEIEDLDYK